MTKSWVASNSDEPQPFFVVNRRTNALPSGHYTPQAEVALGPVSSLKALLPNLTATDMQTLLAVMALVTANGHVNPTADEVADILGVPTVTSYVRLYRLTQKRFRDTAVMVAIRRGSYSTFIPSGMVLGSRLGPLELIEPKDEVLRDLAGRSAVIAHTRNIYAKPRESVEADIAAQQGFVLPLEFEANEVYLKEPEPKLLGTDLHVRTRLVRLGCDFLVADELVRQFGARACSQQIAWLPYRRATSPVKVLISSIKNDFAAPPLPGDRGTN